MDNIDAFLKDPQGYVEREIIDLENKRQDMYEDHASRIADAHEDYARRMQDWAEHYESKREQWAKWAKANGIVLDVPELR